MAAAEAVSAAEAKALFADLADCPALVLAISGGPDSTALLVLAARWRAALKRGPKLLAITVDHGLRPDSAREAKAVGRLAKKLGIAHRTLRWTGRKPATRLQERARAERYRLIGAAARKAGATHILTAHTLDDQAETVLIRLARGSGLAGLAAMARASPLPATGEGDLTLLRPFLGIPKSRLIATLENAGVPFADDPSNRDPRFTRARLRGLMPALAAEGLDAGRLARLAQRAARVEAALEAAVEAASARLSATQWPEAGPILLDAAGFRALEAEVALRLLGRAITRTGDEGPVELGKLEALLDALAGPTGGPRPVRLRRTLAGALVTLDAGRLTVERAPRRRQRAGSARVRRAGRRPRGKDMARRH